MNNILTYKDFSSRNEASQYETDTNQIADDINAYDKLKQVKSNNDNIIKSLEKELKSAEDSKKKVTDKIEKIEKVLSNTEFTGDNAKTIQDNKKKLEEELSKFDKIITGIQDKITKLSK